jgi:hypothetical protein
VLAAALDLALIGLVTGLVTAPATAAVPSGHGARAP